MGNTRAAAHKKNGDDPTLRQRRFGLRYLVDLNATKAYQEVYGVKDDNVAAANGSRLLRNAKVRRIIAESTQRATEKAELTLESHLNELAFLRDAAIEDDQISAAVSAEVARGKAAGLYTEKIDHSSGGKPVKYVTFDLGSKRVG